MQPGFCFSFILPESVVYVSWCGTVESSDAIMEKGFCFIQWGPSNINQHAVGFTVSNCWQNKTKVVVKINIM